MSKKLFSTAKWKKYLRSRQLYELKKLREHKRSRRLLNPPKRSAIARLPFVKLIVPGNFSIINNPEETIAFVRECGVVARWNNLNLDLSKITQITADAITVLIAVIQGLVGKRLVNGNLPAHAETSEILAQSGFFAHVRSKQAPPPGKHGRISRQESKKVEPLVARDLIQIGTAAVRGQPQRSYAAYRTLIECMTNTHNHAAGKHRRFDVKETWYSTVYADVKRSRICYTFLDTGVGIFRSVRIGTLRRAYKLLRIEDDRDILKDILEGKVESSTGHRYRGKGLPSIYDLSKRGSIKSLIIIANDVFANVSTGEYRILRVQFPGTLLYWETL
jgi:hypothetical protein